MFSKLFVELVNIFKIRIVGLIIKVVIIKIVFKLMFKLFKYWIFLFNLDYVFVINKIVIIMMIIVCINVLFGILNK